MKRTIEETQRQEDDDNDGSPATALTFLWSSFLKSGRTLLTSFPPPSPCAYPHYSNLSFAPPNPCVRPHTTAVIVTMIMHNLPYISHVITYFTIIIITLTGSKLPPTCCSTYNYYLCTYLSLWKSL